NMWFLNAISREPIPKFLSARLRNAQAYAVTLGELGIVYWMNIDARWDGPYRVWCEVGDEEIRSGLECGDCTRGGISAALIARQRKNAEFTREDYQEAFAFGAWCGTTKVRFFSLWDFHDALARQSEKLLEQVKTSQLEFGEESLKLRVQVENLSALGVAELMK